MMSCASSLRVDIESEKCLPLEHCASSVRVCRGVHVKSSIPCAEEWLTVRTNSSEKRYLRLISAMQKGHNFRTYTGFEKSYILTPCLTRFCFTAVIEHTTLGQNPSRRAISRLPSQAIQPRHVGTCQACVRRYIHIHTKKITPAYFTITVPFMPALHSLRALLLRRVPDDGADNRTSNRKHGHVGAPGALGSGGRIPAPSQ